jgi:hypothetical protein
MAGRLGRCVLAARDAEVRALERGQHPATPPNAPSLLAVGMDGGRVQTRDKRDETGSRWRENKSQPVRTRVR